MTHYTRRYLNTTKGSRQALLDGVQWLGFRRALIFAKYIKYSDVKPLENYHLLASLTGLQGRPVTEMVKRWKPEAYKETEI